MGLDGNSFFPLKIHRIKLLCRCFTHRNCACRLHQTVGKSCFSVIDVSDNGEVSGQFSGHGGSGKRIQGLLGGTCRLWIARNGKKYSKKCNRFHADFATSAFCALSSAPRKPMIGAVEAKLRISINWLLAFASVANAATESVPIDPADDFSPGLFFIALIGLVVTLAILGICLVLAVIVAVSCLLFVALGILSTSAITGMLRGKLSAGLRAFHYQICAVIAIPAGIAGFWILGAMFQSDLPFAAILIIGAAAGCCAGLSIAFVLDKTAEKLRCYFGKKKAASAGAMRLS